MTNHIRVLSSDQSEQWTQVLGRCVQHDFYFLPAYHALAERSGEGEARLFVYENECYTVAVPLLLRRVADVPELEGMADGWMDATSVYGYAGPIASHEAIPQPVLRDFQETLRGLLREMRVTSVFSRLHPLLSQRTLLAGIGECSSLGKTVSIDLTLSPEAQRSQYNENTRRRLVRAQRAGAVVIRDEGKHYMGEFVSIYHETMRRVGAESAYFFDEDYFAGFAEALGPALELFVVTLPSGEVIGGSLFTLCDGIMQFHLGGTRDSAMKLSPAGLLMDGARLWGNDLSARVLHLGGGVGARTDSLFQFKAGFSDRYHDFATWRWIVSPNAYTALAEERDRWNMARGLAPASPTYFPLYRCPSHPQTAMSQVLD